MTGREDDLGRTLRSVLLEETNAVPVDTRHAAEGLRRRLAHTRKRRRVTLAVAASVVAAVVAASVAGAGSASTRTSARRRTRYTARPSRLPGASSMRTAASTPTEHSPI
jgi:hypothetical protein